MFALFLDIVIAPNLQQTASEASYSALNSREVEKVFEEMSAAR